MAKFDGCNLRTYLNGKVCDERTASAGECYYVQPRGQSKSPIVTKAEMPASRGQRIAWALSFVGESKIATDFNSFMCRYQAYVNEPERENKHTMLMSHNKRYAFVLEIVPHKPNPKPILAWVDDLITYDEIDEMISIFTTHRKLFCPEEFLKLL